MFEVSRVMISTLSVLPASSVGPGGAMDQTYSVYVHDSHELGNVSRIEHWDYKLAKALYLLFVRARPMSVP